MQMNILLRDNFVDKQLSPLASNVDLLTVSYAKGQECALKGSTFLF